MHPIGTLASATVRGVPGVRVLAATDGRNVGWSSAVAVGSFTFHPDDQVADVTAYATVAVTDTELDLLRAAELDDLADRLEAGRAMPKPIEPTDRGALVLDQDGHQWVRTGDAAAAASWAQHETGQVGCTYADVDAVAVLP